jgi:hypothetical protein
MELLVKPEILTSCIYGAPCKARNVNVVYVYIDLRLATPKAVSFYLLYSFNNESM